MNRLGFFQKANMEMAEKIYKISIFFPKKYIGETRIF
jgi:hypothetical protein